MNFLFSVSYFLQFFTSCLFASYPVFYFMSPEIKVIELRKKQETHSNIDKTVIKKEKVRGKEQETGNKEYIVEQA